MSKAILQNDVIDVIYDTICGYPLNEAYEILENHRAGKYIPIEWIKNVWLKNPDNQGEIDFFPPATFEVVMNWLIEDWEKENAID